MVLSETRARWRGLTLVLVIRGGLRSVEYLGETAGQANTLAETSPRTIGSDRTSDIETVLPYSESSSPSAMSFAMSVSLDPRVLLSSTSGVRLRRSSAPA